ncbi:MAG: aminotransferase class V-fold PLP-dependent enzyme [Pirellulaceae bacterium]
MTYLPPDNDDAWDGWRAQWRLRDDTLYLNHGSFGPPPEPVREAQQFWKNRLDTQPMDFLTRRLAPAWLEARKRVADFLHTDFHNLIFVTNATEAMNLVAHSFPLSPGDEVLLTDHEYGAVRRIWQQRAAVCRAECRVAALPLPLESAEQVLATLDANCTDRTRLLVVSHITSPTAIRLPVERICQAARRRGIAVCIDGPHAVAQLPLQLDALDCSFYAASCHKWLSAPFGTGFLYVAPPWQAWLKPMQISWGLPPPDVPQGWDDEFFWQGTRDPSPWLALPAAIDFLSSVGWDAFRQRSRWLARYARQQLAPLSPPHLPPVAADLDEWYTGMAHVPLPAGDRAPLQNLLWTRFGIEVPIIGWRDRRWVRVSCHLYNRSADIDALARALSELIQDGY